jgi:hypothetical protein
MSEPLNETNQSDDRDGRDDGVEATPRSGAVRPGSVGFVSESSSERWLKYGLNVLLVSLLVVILAGLVVWAAQESIPFFGKRISLRARADTTSSGSYSLKPQTVSVISEIKSPVKLVSLYPRLAQEPGKKQNDPNRQQEDFYQPVDDILQEYKRKGRNIEVDSIDPVNDPAKLDAWLGEVTRKYGGNVKQYRELLEAFPKTLGEIKKVAQGEVVKMQKLPEMEFKDERQYETLHASFNTVRAFPVLLESINEDIAQELKEKIPDYKGRVRNVEVSLGTFSRQVEAVRKALEELQKSETAPQAARDYAKDSLASFDAMKKQSDDVLGRIKGLGELKLDEVRQRLVAPEGEQPPPAIAVMGENDIKLIDFSDVWKSGESTGLVQSSSAGAPRLRFAGEQQLTAAILSLTQPKKTKIAFVRGGGPAKTTGGGMMGGEAPYSEIASRLKAYNFEVLEKDVSGQAAQRAMMGGMPPVGEPSDEDLKDALWVVTSEPQMTQFGPMPGGSPELAAKLKEHLDRGGSAICLFDLQGDDLSSVLKEWGVEVKANTVAVHEPVQTDAGPADDFIEEARRRPPIFVINEYGGPHPISGTLQSLDAALVPMLPVLAPGAANCEVVRLLPVPQEPRSWGESNIPSVTGRRAVPAYDPASGDMAGPMFAAAAVQRKDKGRLVVIGCSQFINNFMLTIPDQKLYQRSRVEVARFPGNGELFTNSVFWAAGMDKMIALSPSALDTPRIRPMSANALAFWRYGVLLIGLPLLALASGVFVYLARRD